MSGPRIFIRASAIFQDWEWTCTRCKPKHRVTYGFEWDLAAAADAGRAHLAEHHAQGYCRLHGVHRSVCGCRVASVDPDALGGPEKPVQRFDQSGDCAHCDTTPPDCDASIVGGCCTACRATGGCTHQPRNPLQTAHNQSREGA